jgi:hypothetical protein
VDNECKKYEEKRPLLNLSYLCYSSKYLHFAVFLVLSLLHPDVPWLLKVEMALLEAWQDALEPQDSSVKQEDSLKLGGVSKCSDKHISPTIQIPAK